MPRDDRTAATPLRSPLHAIVDVDASRRAGWDPAALARAYAEGGAAVIQLRAKHLGSGPFLDLSIDVVAAFAGRPIAVVVNDRADVARLANAAGVHVGQEDLSATEARTLVGPSAIVGVSTHSIAQLEDAVRQPISYVAVGPVFGTTTKDTGYAAVGLDLVRAAARLARNIPVVAIGGITLETAPDVLAAGATSVAVIGDLLATGSPAARVSAYMRRLS